ncbi:DNA/RNA non-specific endonuclease [Leptolyngbya sp. NIES-2104]|uniref:DNA/RNA non-specific endonuclease n=1 Tax=Leptolyngbya sp. NIES-2104 TaxID=1552121 RepID=UPI0006EC5FD7|nr:DNA/RNA non-specific endonuclease [Leptolyngbya sp. NIES-2104]GAQ00044.1 DNA/RNA non-specific endonuclease [Leptolyngbya sp. NIES-2104]
MSLKTVTYNDQFLDKLKALRSQKPTSPENPLFAQVESRDRTTDSIAAFARRVDNIAASGSGVSSFDLERVLGRNDLLPVNYLQKGSLAARAVCRIWVGDIFGSNGSWGTGFLVSPRLLITNHHVIHSIDEATRASVQFSYEMDINGRIRDGKTFQLSPQEAFVTDAELDFTLVAVAEQSEDQQVALSDYGFLRLDPTLHKVEPEEFVTVIQHPNGQPKQIAIRENKVLKIGDAQDALQDNFLWYASDTAPGSSGSPVLNDNWQVVAVHHKSVVESRTQDGVEEVQLTGGEWVTREAAEKLSEDKIKWVANQGVRTSRILDRISKDQSDLNGSASGLIQALLQDARGIRVFPGTTPRESVVSSTPDPLQESGLSLEKRKQQRSQTNRSDGSIRPLSYYQGRKGYDPNFLGVNVPLPELTPIALAFGPVATIAGTQDNVLHYTHFSIVMCETRRLAFVTAVNIDGKQWVGLERGKDEWFFDPRLPEDFQLGNRFYGNEAGGNFFDRGHLVRRQDPIWGEEREARLANSDTFHFTNCSPQYFEFNQSAELWQGLENFILTNTDQEDLLATVFTGPIFQQNDVTHRGIQVPQFFWKIVLVVDRAKKLFSSAYVVSQEKFVDHIPFERLPVGEFNHFQVPVAEIETRTGLKFADAVRQADVYKGSPKGKGLRGFSDIEHPRRA